MSELHKLISVCWNCHVYIQGGDLFDAITQSIKFDEKTSAGMVTDLTNALFYLHSQHIVHRDLKPENLLVSNLVQISQSNTI